MEVNICKDLLEADKAMICPTLFRKHVIVYIENALISHFNGHYYKEYELLKWANWTWDHILRYTPNV